MSILMSGYQEFDNTDRRQGMIEKYKIVITFEDEEERTYIYDDEEEMGETLEFYYDCNCGIRPGLNKILGIFMD